MPGGPLVRLLARDFLVLSQIQTLLALLMSVFTAVGPSTAAFRNITGPTVAENYEYIILSLIIIMASGARWIGQQLQIL